MTDLRNRWIPSNLAMSRYRYAYDTLGRREYVTRTGEAFADSNSDIWTYNDRNELTVSERYLGAGTPPPTTQPVATLDREYDYDPIGNRTRHKEGTSADVYYCANELNQYDTLDDASSCPPGSADETLSCNITRTGISLAACETPQRPPDAGMERGESPHRRLSSRFSHCAILAVHRAAATRTESVLPTPSNIEPFINCLISQP